MKSSEDGGCSNEIARAFKENFEFTEIGNLTIMKNPQFLDDLSQISEQYTAFQGSFIHPFLEQTLITNAVTVILPKEKFLNDYKVPWKKETLQLTDTFYSILRTMYRYKLGSQRLYIRYSLKSQD